MRSLLCILALAMASTVARAERIQHCDGNCGQSLEQALESSGHNLAEVAITSVCVDIAERPCWCEFKRGFKSSARSIGENLSHPRQLLSDLLSLPTRTTCDGIGKASGYFAVGVLAGATLMKARRSALSLAHDYWKSSLPYSDLVHLNKTAKALGRPLTFRQERWLLKTRPGNAAQISALPKSAQSPINSKDLIRKGIHPL
jgi:hypothetical protein